MIGLRPRDRRALAVGAVSVLGMLGVTRGLPAWKAWVSESRDRAWQAEAGLLRLTGAIGGGEAVVESLALARRRYLAAAPALLGGRSAATAGASLIGLVSLAAGRSGLELTAVQATGDPAAGRHFVRVAVRGEGAGDIIGLAAFLRAIESGPARLTLRELAVDQADPGGPASQPEVLRIRFLVEGVGLRGEEPQ